MLLFAEGLPEILDVPVPIPVYMNIRMTIADSFKSDEESLEQLIERLAKGKDNFYKMEINQGRCACSRIES